MEYLHITPGNSLYFPGIDFLRTSVGKAARKDGVYRTPVVVDCRHVGGADFTAARGVAALIQEFNDRKQPIYFFRPRQDVLAVFKGAGLDTFQHVASHDELETLLSGNNLNISCSSFFFISYSFFRTPK